ncbi:MAG: hypothetical protein JNN12_15965 [Bacteroidetes Order II. Incertae sedis bacterium]|nr:hypothetical protein [Bacteroidetes Order II. bacterium]
MKKLLLLLFLLPTFAIAQRGSDGAPVADGKKLGIGLDSYGLSAIYDINRNVSVHATLGSGWWGTDVTAAGWYRLGNHKRSDSYVYAKAFIGDDSGVGVGAGLEWSWGKLLQSEAALLKRLYGNWDIGVATSGRGLETSGGIRIRFGR